MKIRCAWHPKYFGTELMMGEKEPLDNQDTTDGICTECSVIFTRDIKRTKYSKCPECGKNGLYKNAHFERCIHCDAVRVLIPASNQ